MGSKNSMMIFADRIARQIIAEQTRARIAISFDGAIIAANKALHMGPGRAAAFANAYHEAMDWLAEMFISDCDDNKDKRLEYAKAKRDELILRIVGAENFAPFDKSYGEACMDELKRVRVMMNTPDLPLKLGDMVYFLIYEDEAFGGLQVSDPTKVSGVGYRGFCCSAEADDPDDMGDFYEWNCLGRDAFRTREAAEAAVKKIKEGQTCKGSRLTSPSGK